MKTTIQIKLLPNKEQADSLLKTIENYNEACNFVSNKAWELKTASHILLHKECYYLIREKFNLSSQMAVRAIGKVSDSYKTDKKHFHIFSKHGAICLDNRLLAYKRLDNVSISSLDGRLIIPFVIGDYFKSSFTKIKGQADLIYKNGKFFLYQTADIPDKFKPEVTEFLGIDVGIANIAVDSTGEIYSSNKVNSIRAKHQHLRSKLQSIGTKSAKRKLKKLSGKEKRFAKDINHCISKKIVLKAKDTGKGISLENLKGIRFSTTVRKAQRRKHSNWSFFDLQSKIAYKAKLEGVEVKYIAPAYTSQTCSNCGSVSKHNRKSQSKFVCLACGSSFHADINAAINIGRRAVVNLPIVEGSQELILQAV